ncbi:hypothetical protein [Fodinicola feengrottensis]|uniref:hypothetical protein n=1 Tax=Fodinicola feengrottensis TaxID=435914 RepID=UPI0013D63063|nr:hypothetical protein [Fodinicola feengrottensis]
MARPLRCTEPATNAAPSPTAMSIAVANAWRLLSSARPVSAPTPTRAIEYARR